MEKAINEAGFSVLGTLPVPVELCPEQDDVRSRLVLIGWTGAGHWQLFADSQERRDGLADPLDRWTRRVVDALAHSLGATALYPFEGPPWHPFQTWAKQAGIAFQSPIGLLVHPEYGFWHSYRAALILPDCGLRDVSLKPESPCLSCVAKPCLSACPVGAYTMEGFDVAGCRRHLASDNAACLEAGCFSRDACPVGRQYRYCPDQIAFHQHAFAPGC